MRYICSFPAWCLCWDSIPDPSILTSQMQTYRADSPKSYDVIMMDVLCVFKCSSVTKDSYIIQVVTKYSYPGTTFRAAHVP